MERDCMTEKRIPADWRKQASQELEKMLNSEYDTKFIEGLPEDDSHALFLCELSYQISCYLQQRTLLQKKDNDKLRGYMNTLNDNLDEHDKRVLNTEIDHEEYKCICCEKVTQNHGLFRSNINKFAFGYNSTLDCRQYEITICDKCMEEKHEKGVVKYLKDISE